MKQKIVRINGNVFGAMIGRSAARKLSRKARRMERRGYRLAETSGPNMAGNINARFEKVDALPRQIGADPADLARPEAKPAGLLARLARSVQPSVADVLAQTEPTDEPNGEVTYF